jgi:[glutamine synthetase] adenylyltransferase / [glutamine synthetase]-adenylyl-L-tyrosine phosphorylase
VPFVNPEQFTEPLLQRTQSAWQHVLQRSASVEQCLSIQQQLVLKAAVGLSDFVLKTTLQWPELIVDLFREQLSGQPHNLDYNQLFSTQYPEIQQELDLYQALRCFRHQQMCAIAINDLVLEQPLEQSLQHLSELADCLIIQALHWLTGYYQDKWGVPLNAHGDVQPLLVYGMGKLGGKELNFSSDIDLIFAYPEAGQTDGTHRPLDNQQFFSRLAQKLIAALAQTNQDGFVFRVDMRLRPFGESGPLVLCFNAMEDYYQQQGRDWERYAMLKARLIGDSVYHRRLSNMLRPFVYRRYIDFSVIDSLRRMKMMIAQEVRRKNLINNIKLGAGGIREIEFIVQVFQLLRGGQIPELQQRNLLAVLPLLAAHHIISLDSANILRDAYVLLRRVENILQALADQQTQTLPDDELAQTRILAVLQIENWASLLALLQQHMQQVHLQFKALIGEEQPNNEAHDHFAPLWLGIEHWQTDEIDDWLVQHANTWQASNLSTQLRSFKADMDKRHVGQRGRLVLDKLIPVMLWHVFQQQASERSVNRILTIIDKISTRTAYLELLFENEGALKHLIRLAQDSAWISEHIAKYPILLDELIDPKLFTQPPQLSSYRLDLPLWLLRISEDDLEAQMNCLRQFKQAQLLRIAVADVVGVLPVTQVSAHLTAVAEAIIEQVINLSWQQMGLKFGVPVSTLGSEDKGLAVIGYGKMGGIELAYGSDLDLVFLHHSDSQDLTSGDKQLSAGQFYAKLVQRIMHMFNTRMASGILYELDMRLRPSGNSGLLAVHIDSFAEYQLTEAWTWEHQALVRARPIYGNEAMKMQFQQIKQQVLIKHRSKKLLQAEVIEMRRKMREHLDRSSNTELDVKHGTGGLVDIEFIAQYLVLLHAQYHPELSRYSDNINIFKQLASVAVLTSKQSEQLISGYCELRDIGHRATLHNQSRQLVASTQIASSSPIAAIWQRIFG